MKTNKTEGATKQPLRERLQQRLQIQNEARFYFILQLIFAAAQIALAYVAFWEQNFTRGGVILFAVFGIILMLIAGKGWQSAGMRVLGRVLSVAAILLFTVVSILDAFTAQKYDSTGLNLVSRTLGDQMGHLVCRLCQYVQPLALLLFPAYLIGARRVQRTADIRTVQIGSWAIVLLAFATWMLSREEGVTRMIFSSELLGISNNILLIAYLIATLASVVSVLMLYPYGVQWVKKMVDKARGELTPEETVAPAEEEPSAQTEE